MKPSLPLIVGTWDDVEVALQSIALLKYDVVDLEVCEGQSFFRFYKKRKNGRKLVRTIGLSATLSQKQASRVYLAVAKKLKVKNDGKRNGRRKDRVSRKNKSD